MKKSIKRTLSLLLALTMVLSLGLPAYAVGVPEDGIAISEEPAVKPANLPIGAGKQPGIIEDDEIISDDLIVDIVDEETVVEENAAPAKDFSYSESATGFSVEVSAPVGALPLGTEMVVDRLVDLSDVQAAVDRAENLEGKVRLAADISFWLEGKEIEPAAGSKLLVRMSSPEIEGIADPIVVHIPDGVNAVPEIVEQMKADEDVVMVNTVEFETDSFSTYAIVSGEDTITVHWGTMNGEKFEEFDETMAIGLDTSASSVSLDVDFEGYAFSVATCKPANSENTFGISSTLKKVDGVWQAQKHSTNDSGETVLEWVNLNDGDEIFVIYVVPQSQPDAPGEDEEVPTPDTQKHVVVNEDGTRTIVLDVTGTTVSETDSLGANVLILLDRTGSMSNYTSDGTNRMVAAKAAIQTLVDVLTEGDNPGVVNYALLDFYVDWGGSARWSSNEDRLHVWNATTGAHATSGNNYWTTNATEFNTNYIQRSNYTYASGSSATNWESPLNNALTILGTRNTANKTYVIFVTDGEPNTYGTGNTVSDPDTQYYGNYYMNQANYAAVRAITQLSDVSLYGVFCGNSSGYNTLNTTVMNNGGKQVIDGADSAVMSAAFGDIAHTIVEEMGASNVSVDDGVPSLSSVSAQTSGEAGGFEYYTVDKDGNETVWAEAPGASYNQANGVTWDLSSVQVTPDVTYRLKFTVWPSQEAYDTIANLNNGLITMTQEELDAAGIGGNKDDGYYLLTNTHLKTDFSFGDKDYSVSPEVLPKDEMILPTTTVTITKIWHNDLDLREASDVRLTVTKDGQPYLYDEGADDDENKIRKAIPMTNAEEKTDEDGNKYWIQSNATPIYISMGQMTVNGSTIDVISSGHDYEVTEPESFSYNWELTSDVYHPMVINGKATVLVEVKDTTGIEIEQNQTKKVGSETYYAFNNKVYVAKTGENVLTAVNDRRSNLQFTKVVTGDNVPEDALFTFQAKVTYPEDVNDDVWFSIQDENGDYILNGDYGVNDYITGATQEPDKLFSENPSYQNPVYHEADDVHHYNYWTFTRYGEEDHRPAVGTEADGKFSTGFYFAPDDTEFTLKIRAGWNVYLSNMPNKTVYEFTETDIADGFVFTKVEGTAESATGDDGTPGVVDSENAQKISGTIDKPNNKYLVTFTNEYRGCFYVYHAGDNTVERIFFTDSRIVNGKFNIAKETKDQFIYGGYYEEGGYADAAVVTSGDNAVSFEKKGDDYKTKLAYVAEERTGGSWGKVDGGKVYMGDGNKWTASKAIDENGMAMTPVVNTVYYLKEVPEAYLRGMIRYTYYDDANNNYPIGALWLVCALDGEYKQYGIIGEGVKSSAGLENGSLTSALTIKPLNAKTEDQIVTYEAKNFLTAYNTKHKTNYQDGIVGYVKVYEKYINDSKPTMQLIDEDEELCMFWVTPDNIRVTGTRLFSITNIGGAGQGSTNKITLNKLPSADVDHVQSTLTPPTSESSGS